jgi:hypothetical protein
VQAFPGAEEHGTRFVDLVAHSDDGIQRLVEVALERLALLTRDDATEFVHCSDRQRPHARRLGTSRERLEAVSDELTQQALCYLTAR